MSRCILVLGTGRSGTSAVAGCLHKLGCHMGDIFQPSDQTNQWGTFEDAEFRRFDKMVVHYNNDGSLSKKNIEDTYARLVAARNGRKMWGVKDPDMVRTVHHVLPLLDDARLVVIKRGRAATVASYIRAYHRSETEANAWFENSQEWLEWSLAKNSRPVLEMQFEKLLTAPVEQVGQLAEFAFENVERPSETAFKRAVEHIRGARCQV